MQKSSKTNFGSANTPDYTAANSSVAVCFADPNITHLFAALLEARGVHAQVVSNLNELSNSTKIITEPMMLPNDLNTFKEKILVIGNHLMNDQADIISLARPLTEEKIDRALAQLL